MDVSPLGLGPENYRNFDPKWGEPVNGDEPFKDADLDGFRRSGRLTLPGRKPG